MENIAVLSFVLILAFLAKEIAKRLRLPIVVIQILVGIILGIPLVKNILFDPSSLSLISLLSQLGILFLLFLAGLEISIEKVIRCAKDTILIALSSTFFPFVFGFLFLYFIFGSWLESLGFDSFIVSVVFGIGMAVTAEGTTTKILMDLGVINTKLGAIMLGAGTVDNLIEVFGLALVLVLAQSHNFSKIILLPIQFLVFSLVIFALFILLSRVLKYVERREIDIDLYFLAIIFVFAVAALSQILQLGFLIGAIVAGFLLQLAILNIKKKTQREKLEEEEVKEAIKLMTLAFLAPLFFINIGLSFDLSSVFFSPPLLLGTIVIAVFGKIFGTLILKPISTLNLKQLYLTGWAMNSRGAMELIIALTALNFKLIPIEIFSVMVATSLITTLIFPLILQNQIQKNPEIMN